MVPFRWISQILVRWQRLGRIQRAKQWHYRTEARPFARALEPRRVLNAAPVVPQAASAAQPAQVVVNAGKAANDGKADTYVISKSAAGDVVTINGKVQQIVAPGEKIVIQGSSDNDIIQIDFSNGNPLSTNEIWFAGNGGADSIQLTGTAVDVMHHFAADGTGRIVVDGGIFNYSANVTVSDSLSVTQRTFELDDGENLEIGDSTTSGIDEARGQYGQDVKFVESSASLQINASQLGSVTNQITINSLDTSVRRNLTINGDSSDSVIFVGMVDLNSGDLTATAGTIYVSGQIQTSSANVQLLATSQLTIDSTASIVDAGGQITADAGPTGTLWVYGKIDASNLQAGQTGGAIHLLGNQVGLSGAMIDARGDAGGGEILVGGDFHGTNASIRNASQTIVDKNTTLNASAVRTGNGGNVVVWSNDGTVFSGQIISTGGSTGGNGGNAEVSGGKLGFDGLANLSSAYGKAGSLLLDPKNIIVKNAGSVAYSDNVNNKFANVSSANVTISATSIVAILNGGTAVTLQANNDLTITDDIIANNPGGNGGDLILQAGRSILINANITTDSGNLFATANETAANGVVDADRDAGNAVITISAGNTINAGTGSVNLHVSTGAGLTNHGSGDLTLGNIQAATLTATNYNGQILDASTAITITNNASFTGTAITVGGAGITTNFGSVTLNSTGAVVIQEDSATALAGDNTAASLSLTSTGAITDGSTSLAVTNNATFSGTAITVGGAGTTTNFGSLTFTSAGAVTIQEDSDTALAGVNTASSLSLTSTGAITDGSTSLAVTNNASFSGTAITVGGAGITTNFGSLTFNSAGAVTIQEDSDTALAAANTAGSLSLTSTGAITDGSTSLAVTNNANFSGTAITVGGAGITTNFGSLTFNSAGAVTIQEDSATALAGDNTAGSLSLTSTGAITDGSTSLAVTNNASFSGTAITVGGAGTTTNFGTLTFNSTGNVTIQEDSGTALAGANTAGSLSLTSTGAITDGSTSLAVTNNASFSGTAITVGGAGITTNFGSLTFNSAGAVTIQEDSATALAGDNTAASLGLTSTGAITDGSTSLAVTNNAGFSGTAITVGGAGITTNFGSLTFNSTGNVTIQEDSDTALAGANTAGSLSLTSTGAITDGSTSLAVTNNASFSGTAITVGGAGITTNFGSLTFNSAGNVTIQEDSDTALAGANTADSLNLTSTGAITDGSTSLAVTNNASFSGTAITVGGAGITTNFGSLTFNSAGAVTIQEDSDTSLAGANTAGSLSLTSTGAITDGSTSLAVTGNTSFSGTAITVGGAGTTTNFGSLTFNSTGNVTIQEDSATALAGTNTAGSLNLTSTGAISDGSTSLAVTGNADFSGTAISVGGAGITTNFGTLTFNSAGSVTIQEDSSTALTGVNTAGSLSLTSAGAITDGSTSLAVTNNASFNGTAITVGGAGITTNFGSLTFNSTGDVSIQEDSAMVLTGANTANNVRLDASGDITQPSGSITAQTMRLISTGSIGTTAQRIQADVKTVAASANGNIIITVNDTNHDGVNIGAGDGNADGLQGLTTTSATGLIDLIENSSGAGGSITVVEAVSAVGGGVSLRGNSPIIVNTVVSDTGGGNILLAAEGNTAADDLTINANVTTSGGNGNIQLFAGDTISETAGQVISTAGTGAITARAGTNYNGGVIQDGTSTGALTMDATATMQTQDGNITLRAPGDITVGVVNANSNNDATLGNVLISADDSGASGTQSDGSGAIIDGNGATLNVTAGGLALSAASGIASNTNPLEMQVQTVAAKNTTTNGIYLEQLSAGGDLTVGTTGGLTGLNTSTANSDIDVKVDNGQLQVNGAVQAGTGTVRLQSTGDITQTQAITGGALGAISTGGNIVLSLATNNVTSFAAQATAGGMKVNYRDADDVKLDTIAADTFFSTAIAGVNVSKTAGSTVRLRSGGSITQDAAAPVIANALGAEASVNVDLCMAQNDINVFAAKADLAAGTIALRYVNPFSLTTPVTADGTLSADLTNVSSHNLEYITDGDLVVDTEINITGTLTLISTNGSITQSAKITAGSLAVQAKTFVDLSTQINNVDNFAASAGQYVYYRDADSVTITTITGDTNCNIADTVGVQTLAGDIEIHAGTNIVLNQVVNAPTHTVRLLADGGTVTQNASGKITANGLGVTAQGLIDLTTSANNDVRQFAASSTGQGDISFKDNGNLTITTVPAGASITTPVVGVVGGNIDISTVGATADIVVNQPVDCKSAGTIKITAPRNLTVNATIGNVNATSVTLQATAGQIVGNSTSPVIANEVNLNASISIGAGTINTSALEGLGAQGGPLGTAGNDINWNSVLGGNPTGLYVQTNSLNMQQTGGNSTGSGIWVDVDPLSNGSTVVVSPVIVHGDIVITSQGTHSGLLQLNSLTAIQSSTGGHILVYTNPSAAGAVVGVQLGTIVSTITRSGTVGMNAIAIDSNGALSKLPNYQIVTGNMILLQLLQDAVHGPFTATTPAELAQIYANYNFFQIQSPFPSPSETNIKTLQNNAVITTIGIVGEKGWNIAIDWGDGSVTLPDGSAPNFSYFPHPVGNPAYQNPDTDPNLPTPNHANDPNRPNGSKLIDATTPLVLMHYYTSSTTAVYHINLTVSVDPSISLATHTTTGGITKTTYYEQQTVMTIVQSSIPPLPIVIFFPKPEVVAPPVIPVATVQINNIQPLINPPAPIVIHETEGVAFDKRRYLALYLIPEDGSDPIAVTLIQDGEPRKDLDLKILTGNQLLEQFKNLPDGRYRLELYRTLNNEVLDERTILETVITNGTPSNPLEELIEQLRRTLERETESNKTTKEDSAALELLPNAVVPLTDQKQDDKSTNAAAAGAWGGLFGLLANRSLRSAQKTDSRQRQASRQSPRPEA